MKTPDVLELARLDVLRSLKAGIKPALLVLGQSTYRCLQVQLGYRPHERIGSVELMGFTIAVALSWEQEVLRVHGDTLMPMPCAAPDVPFLFYLAPDAPPFAGLRHGQLYIATDAQLNLDYNNYRYRVAGTCFWVKSDYIIQVEHLLPN